MTTPFASYPDSPRFEARSRASCSSAGSHRRAGLLRTAPPRRNSSTPCGKRRSGRIRTKPKAYGTVRSSAPVKARNHGLFSLHPRPTNCSEWLIATVSQPSALGLPFVGTGAAGYQCVHALRCVCLDRRHGVTGVSPFRRIELCPRLLLMTFKWMPARAARGRHTHSVSHAGAPKVLNDYKLPMPFMRMSTPKMNKMTVLTVA